jgi:hypothetical protein
MMLSGICWADATTEYTWSQVDQPFLQTVKIPLYGQAKVDVDIPADYLENKYLMLRMVLDTPFRLRGGDGGWSHQGFEGFSPSVSVNGSKFSGFYNIRFEKEYGLYRSNAYIKIKSKHLKPGLNNLFFKAGREDKNIQWSCGPDRTNCVAIFVHKLWVER